MTYLFRNPQTGDEVPVNSKMGSVSDVTETFARIGYVRRYTPPNVIVFPTYSEAHEESERLVDQVHGIG